jgi:hypothetical protein
MRKGIIVTLALALAFAGANATYIGYSNGNGNRSNGYRPNKSGEKQAVAIRFSAEKAALLKGAKVTALRSFYGNNAGSDFRIYLAKSLDGEAFAEAAITGKPSSKWADYQLDTPYTITGEEFYLIVSCEMTGVSYKPYVFDESADFMPGISYGLVEGEWSDLSGLGLGAPDLQLVAEDVPEFSDVIVKNVQLPTFIREDEEWNAQISLFNFGTAKVTSLDFSFSADGQEPSEFVESGLNLEQNCETLYTLYNNSISGIGNKEITVSLIGVNDGADQDTSDNQATISKMVYGKNVSKRVLIEEFTGQTCSNCPSGASILNGFCGEDENYIMVAHHAGFYNDSFTMSEDLEYTYFYNSSSTYAPAVMSNRYSDGSNVVSGTSTPTPVFIPAGTNTGYEKLSAPMNIPPYVGIQLYNDYNAETRSCKLTAEVTTYEEPVSTSPRINVFLIQDHMTAYQSSGGAAYDHRHVFRGSLTGVWGEAIALNAGETVVKEYEYTIPEVITSTAAGTSGIPATDSSDKPTDPENMYFVVFVSNIDNDANNCYVWNVEEIPMTENRAYSSVKGLTADDAPARYFDLLGREVSAPNHGIYIEVKNGVAKKVKK